MSFKKRVFGALLLVLVAAAVGYVAVKGIKIKEKEEDTSLFQTKKDTLYFWYTDDALTDYLNAAAVTYNETSDVRIVPELHSGLEYLEGINAASLEGEAVPDLYVVSHDSLEKAYLAGLARAVSLPEEELSGRYMETGLSAATYKDKVIAYPFYFETSALLYNKTYLETMAETSGETLEQLLPKTFEDMKTFADNYDAPEEVEAVFKWDVTDVFYNYFFIGNSVNMGGDAGDDVSEIDIYNEDAIRSLRAYEELNQFFSIDTSEISYASVIQEFIEGKLVFSVATSDVVATLEQAKEDGTFSGEYGIALLPDINEELQTRPLSMTQCIAVNGYSEHANEAEKFAAYVTSEYNPILYARTGKVSAGKNVEYEFDGLSQFAAEYEHSVPMPKMIETGNFWVQLEVLFSKIWNGADANEMLKELSETIMQQVTGSDYTEETIIEEKQDEEVEYLDEEYYEEEALSEDN